MKPVDELSTGIRWGEPTRGPRTLICFGVIRGGTSAVAGMMRMLGVFMGESLRNNHEDPDFIGKSNLKRIDAISYRNASHDIWGWKDPAAVNYLDAVHPNLVNPHYICVFRDSISIGIAQKRWHSRENRFALADIITQQQKNLFWLMNTTDPCFLVSYEKLVENPVDFAKELADFVGKKAGLSDKDISEFLAPGFYKEVPAAS